jgi:spore coat protein U-like protein
MRTALAALAVLVVFVCAWLLADHRLEVHAQGKGGKDKGGKVQCSIDSVTPVAFGSYDADSSTPATSTGELRFSCKPANQTLTVKVTIGPSTVSGSIAERKMRELGGSDQLSYNLFQDQRGSILWGDGVNGGSAAFVTGQKTFRVEIYGIAPPAQLVGEGLYADALRITILP